MSQAHPERPEAAFGSHPLQAMGRSAWVILPTQNDLKQHSDRTRSKPWADRHLGDSESPSFFSFLSPQGPLMTSFPVENRVLVPTQNDLKQHSDRTRSKPWADRHLGDSESPSFFSFLSPQGPLMTSFPVENRVLVPTQNDLKQHLDRTRSKPWADRLADFHLLLYLSNFLDASTDMPMLAQAVRTKEPISEGHQLIIEHLA
ncbi:unnamed protein product [Closterium sp. NIES-53]